MIVDDDEGVRSTLWLLFRDSYQVLVAEDANVLRDIRTVLHWHEPPERRRVRNGQPLPDDTPGARGAWVIAP